MKSNKELEPKTRARYIDDVLASTIQALPYGNTISEHNLEQYRKCIEELLFYDNSDEILAISLPTGSGKSTMMKHVCAYRVSTPELYDDSGTLIVRCEKVDCNETADSINHLVGREAVYSYHSDMKRNRISKEKLMQYPIVALCQAGFYKLIEDNQLDKLLEWRNLQSWDHSSNKRKRKNLIIDEEIASTLIHIISLKDIQDLENEIINLHGHRLYQKFDNFISDIKDSFIKDWNAENNKPKFVSLDEYNVPEGLLKALEENEKKSKSDDESEQDSGAKILERIIYAIQNGSYVKFANEATRKTITTYQYIDINLPQFNIIVLDATASINAKYKFSKNYHIMDTDFNKDYSNVNLHVYNDITGSKHSITSEMDNGFDDALARNILDILEPDDKTVIFFNSKEIENEFKQKIDALNTSQRELHFGHHGNLAGKNIWMKCNKCFLIGFQILPECSYPIYSQVDTEGRIGSIDEIRFDIKPGARHYNDLITEKYRTSIIVSDIVQAINRIKCRVSKDGNAQAADIYLINRDREIDKGIVEAMPGLNLYYDWSINYETLNQKKRHDNPKPEKIFIDFLIDNTRPSGKYYNEFIVEYHSGKGIKKAKLRELYGLTTRQFQRICEKPMFEDFCSEYGIILDKNSHHFDIGELLDRELVD